MPEAPPKAQRGRPRAFDRQAALCAALDVFWREGYEHTTMAMLCKAMGIASPSIYCAFGNKSDLFLEALAYYRETYWGGAFERFMTQGDIHLAVRGLFEEAARILLSPSAPCGCLTVLSAMSMPRREERIAATIASMREDTKKMFRDRLKMATAAGQIPADSDIPAICGALTNFFEGLSLKARDDVCLSELLAIAARGVLLLPQPIGGAR